MKKVIIYYNHARYSGLISHYIYSTYNDRSHGVIISFNYERQPCFFDDIIYI